jgi:hypothetical protein
MLITMETNEQKPETNKLHTNSAPSLEEQSDNQQEPLINKVVETDQPLTETEKHPGGG